MAESPGSFPAGCDDFDELSGANDFVPHAVEQPLHGFIITSSSERAVSEAGHQLTMRLPR